ncbi:hypothetical protein P692DRAFT_20535959 [Suillus brevipes Sb2]|nr:hypothetical protein P692DRAFT_20535959 [Suillus brevipes Sb2]
MIRLPVVYDQMVQDALDHDMAAIETCTQGLPKRFIIKGRRRCPVACRKKVQETREIEELEFVELCHMLDVTHYSLTPRPCTLDFSAASSTASSNCLPKMLPRISSEAGG